MTEPVLLMSPDGSIDAFNPAATSLVGDTGDAASIADVEIALGLPSDTLRAAVSSLEEQVLEADGLAYRVTPFEVGDHVAVILRDVTAEQEHVRRLRSLNQVAREVLTQPSVEIVLQSIVDAAKEITKASFSALLMLRDGSETEASKFVYNAPRELFPDRLPRAVGLLAVPIQTRSAARLEDIRGHPLGVGIPVKHPPIKALLAVPIVADGEVWGELAVANGPDQPDFDEADEGILTELGLHAVQAIRLAQVREESQANDEARQGMLDLLRHDMMTPISTAKGALDLLSSRPEKLTEDQRKRLFEALVRSIDNVERLARNLRSDAHLESPKLARDFSDIDVVDLIEELGRDLNEAASSKGIDLTVRAEADSPTRFEGAYLLVRQALENLLTNAIKFSPSGSTVVLTSRLEGESVRFDVTDEGPGIAVEQQSRIFVRFEQHEQGGVARAGLGLGLSIVRRVAEAHAGSVGVASRPGQGSTFWISFPVTSPLRDEATRTP